MADDLYTQWLGLPAGKRPADHYTLLGLPLFCPDERQIESAARAQLSKLDKWAIHPDRARRDACTRMMNEVARARVVLLDPARRREYDAALKEKLPEQDSGEIELDLSALADDPKAVAALQQRQKPRPESSDDPVDEVLSDLMDKPVLDENVAPVHRKRRGADPVYLTVAGAAVLLVLVGVLIAVAMSLRTPSAPSVEPEPHVPLQPVAEAVERYDEPAHEIFRDTFTTGRLGREYRAINTAESALQFSDNRLLLVGDSHHSVRVDLVPAEQRMFKECSIRLGIEPGAQVTFGIRNGAHMLLDRQGDVISVEVTPGFPGTSQDDAKDWPQIQAHELVNDQLEVRLRRQRGTILWEISDNVVATSPDFGIFGRPALSITADGPAALRAAIDVIEIVFE